MPFLDILQASLLNAILHKCLRQISIIHPIPITMYGQYYEACRAFPDNQWISMLVAFTTVVAESPSTTKVHYNVLGQPNPMHLLAYVTATRHITTIHRHLMVLPPRMRQPMTQWDGRNFATDMDWTEYGGKDCGATAQPVQPSFDLTDNISYTAC